MNFKINAVCALLAVGSFAVETNAATLFDTGTPDGTGFPLALDGSDYYATKFNLSGNFTIDSVSGYVTGGNAGDTFTIALYSDNNGKVGSQLQSAQATFSVDGWNGVSSLNWNENAGNYWVAFEVGASDNFSNLLLPLYAPNPGLATAFSAGNNYQNASAMDYGVRVTGVSSVPLPAAVWMFASAAGLVGGVARRSRAK